MHIMVNDLWQRILALAVLFVVYCLGDLVWLCLAGLAATNAMKRFEDDDLARELRRDAYAAVVRMWGKTKLVSGVGLLAISTLVVVYYVLVSVIR